MAKGRIPDDIDDEEEEDFEEGEGLQDAEGGGEGGSDEEDEEEGQDEYEKDGFIVDEDEDEEPEEEEEEERESSDEEAKARKKKRKKRSEENDELDEDDYELLREHNVFHRPKSGNKTKFKRLKKAGKTGVVDDRQARGGLSDDEDEEEEGGRRGRTAEEELKRSLFGDDEGVPPDDVGEEEEEPEEEDEIGEEDDEMADFIVDEEEGEDDGQAFRRKKAKKKKAPRQAPGISSFALQEAQDIFGDVSALLDARRQQGLEVQKAEMDLEEEEDGFSRRKPSKLLEKQFEPSLLEEKFMTEKDDQIRNSDVPERLQLLEEVVGSFSPADATSKEAEWIYERAFAREALWKVPGFERIAQLDKEEVVKQIASVVHLMHEEKLELPFIAMYRKERCLDLLQESEDQYLNGEGRPKLMRYEALWAVHHWDKKWLLLRRRKLGLEAAYKKRSLYESHNGSLKEELFQGLLEALSEAQSEQAVDDVDGKLNLHFPPDEIDVEPGQFRRPKRRSFYSVCRKAGLGIVAGHFGLTPEKLGENISAMYKRHEVEDEALTPLEVASRHLGNEFRDPESVLKGAGHMVAVEISTEPAVREYVRQVYLEKALVNTKPTSEGNSVIDTCHQYAGVKWLRNKPLDKFDDAQWLLIQKAEEEKLLEVKIGLPEADITNNLVFEALYLSEGVSGTAQLWNEQRKQILEKALRTMLLPAMQKEARTLLALRSQQWVAAQCAAELWNKVSVGPYVDQGPEQREEPFDHDGVAPRVMACCWGPGKPATTFVMLDAAGEIVNILYTGYLTIRGESHDQKERRKQDEEKLLDFVMENQPHVVVLGAANLQCRRMKLLIFEVIFKIVEQHPRDLPEGLSTIGVVFGDETIPQLYENSQASQEQLVGHPGIVRRAVGLGRYLQNPLAMVATLCGPSKEVLSLSLHPMQSFLAEDEVYETVERIMITVANQVGVDVNLAASHDWLFAPLQFISGLGPRKGSYIQRSIQGAGRVSTRKELLATLRLMGRKVFINSAGFIRVRGTGQASTGNQIMDPLDDTRIHPESYELAKRMAEDAFCQAEGTKAEDMDDDALELAIEQVKRHSLMPHLDLDAYASHLAQTGPVSNMPTLQMIRSELDHGYHELRNPFKALSQDEEFHMLSGETEDTLAEGCIVHAKVRKIQQSRVMCDLESGLLGIINKEDLSDESNVDPADKVSEGSIVTCRVKAVNKASYNVDLTCKGSALRSENWAARRPKDPYFSPDPSLFRIEQEKAKKKSEDEKRDAFKPRMIVHPQFQNVSSEAAVEALKEKDVGEFIIRPSRKGPSHLSMTVKIFDGVYVHIDIVEGGKDNRNITSFLRLGKTLTIGEETFEDLDEVIARYIDPFVSHLKEVLRYRKFKRGSKAEVDEALREEKVKNPMRIPYFFSICHEHPGAVILSYIRNVHTVSHEYISVSPKGLKFRKRLFDSTDKLVSYFQKHFKEPIPDVAPRRAMAAMVPPRSPAPSGTGSHKSGQWGPARSGERPPSTGWDSSNSWDRSGGRGRSSGSRGRGDGPSSSWDQQARGGASSSGAWTLPGPPQGAAAWTGWSGPATGGYGGGTGVPGPPGGSSDWERPQQGQRGGVQPAANSWGRDVYSDGPSLTPLSESSWGSRKPAAAGGWGSGVSTWEQPTPSYSGWESEQESHGRGRSGWEEAPGSRAGWDKPGVARTGTTGGWEQSRGDPRRGGGGREASKTGGTGWDERATKEASSGLETSDPPSQSGGSSALWEAPPVHSNSRNGVGSTWDSPTAKEPTSSGWEASDIPSQSGGSSALWEGLPVNSNARNDTGGSLDNSVSKEATPTGWRTPRKGDGTWEKPAEQPTQSESGWASTEPEPQSSGWPPVSSNKDDSSWNQPSYSSPAVSGRDASQSADWNSTDGGKGKPLGEESTDNISQAQENRGWGQPSGRVDRDGSWEKPKEKSTPQSGWDVKDTEAGGVAQNGWDSQPGSKSFRQIGGDRQHGDPRRAGSGWDQQAHGGTGSGRWDQAAGKGMRSSNWDQPATYSPATQSGASYSPTQSGWSTDWDKTPIKIGTENARLPSSKTSERSWNTEPQSMAERSSGWDNKEPGVPGISDTSNEPAAPGTSDLAVVAESGTRTGYDPSVGPLKDQSLPWP